MDERQFFDKLAPEWDANDTLSTSEKIEEILKYIEIRERQNILDLGTGTGVLLPYIAKRIGPSGKITAVDYSMEMLKRAEEKFSRLTPKPEFLNLDFENETIPGEFDRIILYCVYPHLHAPIETLKWLKAVNLKEGGFITIAFPCGPDFINGIHRERHSESDILPSAEFLAEKFRKNGLHAYVAASDETRYIVNIPKS